MTGAARLTLATPTGPLTVTERDGAIRGIVWTDEGATGNTPLLRRAAEQIDAYFAGELRAFDLPLAPNGTEFHLTVWRALCRIPYGETRTYGELATEVGAIARAVGTACGANPIPVVIPCHRILAAGGRTGGFSGGRGVETKFKLLGLEGAVLAL
ncbi:MAG: methylated-DNA--[protein]-cysteine S-methyltransferase [Rhodospirillaceae bacterium]|jgi:methylated-DNA-[protein]-cysteine S-methyltransferase|nr:methylated-DNA--[protein]-cysteine S-methyltransferase [Rhodospirillaceae bacterium]MBT6119028.1 methylated-DNA--[protein]-cysteine S-methyltransferase [Rhodospirillaceae bacterium]